MKTFLKIKRVRVYDTGNDHTVVFELRCGYDIVRSGNEYVNMQTGEVYEPLYDELTINELVGFIC